MYNRRAGLICVGLLIVLVMTTISFANEGGIKVEYLREGGQLNNNATLESNDQSFVPRASSKSSVANADINKITENTNDSNKEDVYSFKEGEGDPKIK